MEPGSEDAADEQYEAGLPRGTVGRAMELAQRAADAWGSMTGHDLRPIRPTFLRHLLLPLAVGEAAGERHGGVLRLTDGAVHADLTDDDAAQLRSLRALLGDVGAEDLAAAAQEWRLPVTPYRGAVQSSPPPPLLFPRALRGQAHRRSHAVRVVDLTTMWAGPLCTTLLAGAGAHVVTIEPECRRDGLRGSPKQFAELQVNKRRRSLDLRRSADRLTFEQLVRSADLVVESFSRRVMPNFGYSPDELRAINPRLVTLAIRAFGEHTAERDWIAYGPGVHATAGPSVERARPRPAVLAYADALTGMAGFAGAAEALASTEPPALVEIVMAEQLGGLGAVRPFDPAAQLPPLPEPGGPALAPLRRR